MQFGVERFLYQAVVRLIVGPSITTHLGGYLDPWIRVKQCSRSSRNAIQPILRSPGHSGTQAMPRISPKASKMSSKASKMTSKASKMKSKAMPSN